METSVGTLMIFCLAVFGVRKTLSDVIVCEDYSAYITCPGSQRISIISASYGRSHDGLICPHSQIRTTSCHSSTSERIVKSWCQGKQRCQIHATNNIFGDPCLYTYKYLEVSYRCVRTEGDGVLEIK